MRTMLHGQEEICKVIIEPYMHPRGLGCCSLGVGTLKNHWVQWCSVYFVSDGGITEGVDR